MVAIEKPKLKKKKVKWSDKNSDEKLETFIRIAEKSYLSYPHLMKKSFVAGIFYGLGTTIGVALVFITLAAIIRWLGFIPFVGDIAKQFETQVQKYSPSTK
jgi:Na+-translocating ferredoxin:NAD+ oxidoreductase RnfA subunit